MKLKTKNIFIAALLIINVWLIATLILVSDTNSNLTSLIEVHSKHNQMTRDRLEDTMKQLDESKLENAKLKGEVEQLKSQLDGH